MGSSTEETTAETMERENARAKGEMVKGDQRGQETEADRSGGGGVNDEIKQPSISDAFRALRKRQRSLHERQGSTALRPASFSFDAHSRLMCVSTGTRLSHHQGRQSRHAGVSINEYSAQESGATANRLLRSDCLRIETENECADRTRDEGSGMKTIRDNLSPEVSARLRALATEHVLLIDELDAALEADDDSCALAIARKLVDLKREAMKVLKTELH